MRSSIKRDWWPAERSWREPSGRVARESSERDPSLGLFFFLSPRVFSVHREPISGFFFLSRGPDERERAICFNNGVTCARWNEPRSFVARPRSRSPRERVRPGSHNSRRVTTERRHRRPSQSCVCEIGPRRAARGSTCRRADTRGVYFSTGIDFRAKPRGRAFKKKREKKKLRRDNSRPSYVHRELSNYRG